MTMYRPVTTTRTPVLRGHSGHSSWLSQLMIWTWLLMNSNESKKAATSFRAYPAPDPQVPQPLPSTLLAGHKPPAEPSAPLPSPPLMSKAISQPAIPATYAGRPVDMPSQRPVASPAPMIRPPANAVAIVGTPPGLAVTQSPPTDQLPIYNSQASSQYAIPLTASDILMNWLTIYYADLLRPHRPAVHAISTPPSPLDQHRTWTQPPSRGPASFPGSAAQGTTPSRHAA